MKIGINSTYFAAFLKNVLSENKEKSFTVSALQDREGIAINGSPYHCETLIKGEGSEGIALNRKQIKELRRILKAIEFQPIVLSIEGEGIKFQEITILGNLYQQK